MSGLERVQLAREMGSCYWALISGIDFEAQNDGQIGLGRELAEYELE